MKCSTKGASLRREPHIDEKIFEIFNEYFLNIVQKLNIVIRKSNRKPA